MSGFADLTRLNREESRLGTIVSRGLSRLHEAIKDPPSAVAFLLSAARGLYYKLRFHLLGRRVCIGQRFKVRGPFLIKGSGSVVIGDDVVIDGRGHPVTLFTYEPSAVIRVGSRVFLNGTRLGCRQRISIDQDCLVADARITDTDFHGVDPFRRHDPDAVAVQPVTIQQRVWIGMGAFILKGVTIGENSVVGAAAVVTRTVPANCLVGGNPAHIIKKLPMDHTIDRQVLDRP